MSVVISQHKKESVKVTKNNFFNTFINISKQELLMSQKKALNRYLIDKSF